MTEDSTDIALRVDGDGSTSVDVFGSMDGFQNAQRMAKALAASTMVPSTYQGNPANCLVALEVANRTGLSPFTVMKNLYIVRGNPAWSGQAVAALVNRSGLYKGQLRYEWQGSEGKGDWGCRAVTTDQEGNPIEGEWVTWKMAKAEGWVDKDGSKWKTMPGQMFRYRAATFFGRAHCPEVLLGFHTSDEYDDIPSRPVRGDQTLNEALGLSGAAEAPSEPEVEEASYEVVDETPVDHEELVGVVRGLMDKASQADLLDVGEANTIELAIKQKIWAVVEEFRVSLEDRLTQGRLL